MSAKKLDELKKWSKEPIKGYVAKIINTTSLVINKGTEDGVRTGMIFQVLDKNTEEIIDPITKESLGGIERVKIEVKVTVVKEKISIAETYRTTRVNVGGSGVSMLDLASAFSPPKYVDRKETLKTDEETWEDLPEEKSKVKTGDPVVQKIGPVE